ncbi:hypothetical protein GGU45_000814 [Niabella hirudinis]
MQTGKAAAVTTFPGINTAFGFQPFVDNDRRSVSAGSGSFYFHGAIFLKRAP